MGELKNKIYLKRKRFFFLLLLIFSYNNTSEFSIGRCPESKSLTFNKSISYVKAPCIDLNKRRSFTFSIWIYLKFTTKGKFPTFYADLRGSSRRHGFFLSVPEDQAFHLTVIKGNLLYEPVKSNEKIQLNTWTHFAVTFNKDADDLSLYIEGKKQEYASIMQGIDFFKHLGEPICTIGNHETWFSGWHKALVVWISNGSSYSQHCNRWYRWFAQRCVHVYMYELKYLDFTDLHPFQPSYSLNTRY